MNLTPEQVERVVAEVVRRLTDAGSTSASREPSPLPATLHLGDRLVTMATLEGRLSGSAKLVVPLRAIVTPQVKDELTKRKIELVRSDAVVSAQSGAQLLVAVDSRLSLRESQITFRGAKGDNVVFPGLRIEMIESQATSSLAGTVKELARHVAARKTPGLLLTEQPFAAVAAAGGTAAHVRSAAEVTQAKKELNVSLFVVEAAKLQRPALARIAATIVS